MKQIALPAALLLSSLYFTSCQEAAKEAAPLDLSALKTEIQTKEDAYAAAE
jgi:hypothetical protein